MEIQTTNQETSLPFFDFGCQTVRACFTKASERQRTLPQSLSHLKAAGFDMARVWIGKNLLHVHLLCYFRSADQNHWIWEFLMCVQKSFMSFFR